MNESQSGSPGAGSQIKSTPAIILAGGFGTRLKSVINDIPKPMAPINGRPFLHYLFKYLMKQNIQEVVMSVGYKHEVISDFLGNQYQGVNIKYSIEDAPPGTGGAIKKAFELLDGNAFVLNGDTFFDIDLSQLRRFHMDNGCDIALSLKRLKNFDRYGTVRMEGNRVIEFAEKKFVEEGLINGGVYMLRKSLFDKVEVSDRFSFEKDILEFYCRELVFSGKEFNDYFIDIGIPEDYEKAQHDLS